ncbi:MAG: hypothetical protein HYZ37_12130 [Candidatus Solibacter usitatus]|nr:hypothetical protein [Candidatus Solibacter usitatus]
MWLRFFTTALFLGCLAWGQARLTLQQLASFIESSIKLKQDDRKVSDYLKKVRLAEHLEERTIEDWQGQGIGPRTVAVLRELAEASKNAPKAAPPPPKPAPVVIPPPSAEEQQKILDEVRQYALSYTKRLPDFICMQVTRRYHDPSGLEFWQTADTITEKLTYFEQKENYQVVTINGRMTEVSHDRLGGASSSGEFGSLLKEIFEPESEAQFHWDRWATLHARRNHVFSYRVAQPKSKWRIDYQRTESVIAGYQGLIYVDADYHSVTRVTLDAIDIPPSFPVQQARTMLDYDFVKIGENEHVLPLRAEVRMRSGKDLRKNVVEFRLYRKFGADATIKFDVPEPLPEEKEQPAAPVKPPSK